MPRRPGKTRPHKPMRTLRRSAAIANLMSIRSCVKLGDCCRHSCQAQAFSPRRTSPAEAAAPLFTLRDMGGGKEEQVCSWHYKQIEREHAGGARGFLFAGQDLP